jgi:hypothetical protein
MVSITSAQEHMDKIIHIWGNGMPYKASTMVVDGSGNIYLRGPFEQDTIYFDSWDNYAVPLDNTDYFLVKIDNTGSLEWTKIISGMGSERIHDIEIDNAGNVYFTGEFDISFELDTLYMETGSGIGVSEGYLCKLGPDGNIIDLFRPSENNEDLNFPGLELDQNGHIYFLGSTQGTTAFNVLFNPDPLIEWTNFFVACINDSFEAEWLITLCDSTELLYPGGYRLMSLKTDKQGHLYISGMNDYGYNFEDLKEFFVSKLNTEGSVIWTDTILAPYYSSTGDLFTDRYGNVYLTGGDYGIFAKYSPEGEKLWSMMIDSRVWTSVVNLDGYTILTYFHDWGTMDGFYIIDPEGQIIYNYPFEGIEVEQLAMDEAGNIYYNGYFLDGITMNGEAIEAEEGYNYVIGILKFAEIIEGTQSDLASYSNNFHLYPNPVKNILSLKTDLAGTYQVEIISMSGRTVQTDEMQGEDYRIDLSFLSTGIYAVTLKSDDFLRTEKIIKL